MKILKFRYFFRLLIFFIGITTGVFSDIHIYFFDVGQGNCILLRNETNAILVDAGSLGCVERPMTTFDNIKEHFLKECLLDGKVKIAGVILTHQDNDHTNLVADILRCADVCQKNIPIFSIKTATEIKDDPQIIRWNSEDCLSEKDLKKCKYSTFETYPKGLEDMENFFNALFCEEEPLVKRFHFLRANWAKFPKTQKGGTNDTCLVFSFEYQGFKILFTGDSTGDALDNYIGGQENPENSEYNRETIANTQILVIPHHGSDNQWCWRWTLNVAKNSPKLIAAIINVDPWTSKHDHPQSWLIDVPWPKSMISCATHQFFYKRGDELRQIDISENIFTTGHFEIDGSISPYIEISIKNEKLQMPGYIEELELRDIPTPDPDEKRRRSAVVPHSEKTPSQRASSR